MLHHNRVTPDRTTEMNTPMDLTQSQNMTARIDHPTDEDLAAYVDRTAAPESRDHVEAHLAECDECRAIVVDAARAQTEVRRRGAVRGLAFGGLVTVAAAALLLVTVRAPEPGEADRGVERADGSSSDGVAVVHLRSVSPADGAVLPRDSATFRWEPDAPDAVYRFTISNDRGAVLVSIRTEAPTLTLDDSARAALPIGAQLFWRVEALFPDLSSAATSVRSVTFRDP